jgi:hypothetical protein
MRSDVTTSAGTSGAEHTTEVAAGDVVATSMRGRARLRWRAYASPDNHRHDPDNEQPGDTGDDYLS